MNIKQLIYINLSYLNYLSTLFLFIQNYFDIKFLNLVEILFIIHTYKLCSFFFEMTTVMHSIWEKPITIFNGCYINFNIHNP